MKTEEKWGQTPISVSAYGRFWILLPSLALMSENESTYIPLGTTHRLENPGKLPLEMIEVQSGSYLGEDEIVRFEDRYGR